MGESFDFTADEIGGTPSGKEQVSFDFTPDELGIAPEPERKKRRWETDIQPWSSHGEGAKRAELTKKVAEETTKGTQLHRKNIKAAGAGFGGVAGAVTPALFAPVTGGTSAALSPGGGVLGAGMGYGLGSMVEQGIYGPDPAEELNKMPSLVTAGPSGGTAGAKRMIANTPRSLMNLVGMPYEMGRTITDPMAKGDFGGMLEAGKEAGVGLADMFYTGTGTRDVVEKFSRQQPFDLVPRNLMLMAEEDPAGALFGAHGGAKIPGAALKVGKSAANQGLRAMTSPQTAADLYRSAMKPTIKEGKAKEVGQAVEHGLETGAVINRKGTGLEKVVKRIEAKEDIINGVLDPSGERIHIESLDRSLDGLRKAAENDIENVDMIRNTSNKYVQKMREHSAYDPATDTVPVQVANAIKRKLYKNLRKGGAYDEGQVLAGRGTAAKGTARSLMTAIEEAVPELGPLNKQLGADLNLQKYLERATRRIENTDVLGMRTRLAMLMGVAAPKYAIISLAAAITDNPSFKSRLAIAIHKANKGKISVGEVNRIVEDIPNRVNRAMRPEDYEPNRQGAVSPQGFERNATPDTAPPSFEPAPRDLVRPPVGEAQIQPPIESQGEIPPPRGQYRPHGEPPVEGFEPNAIGDQGMVSPGQRAMPVDFEPNPQAAGGIKPSDRVALDSMVDQMKAKQGGIQPQDISFLEKKLAEFGYDPETIKQYIRSAATLGGVAALTTLPFLEEDNRDKLLGAGGLMAGAVGVKKGAEALRAKDVANMEKAGVKHVVTKAPGGGIYVEVHDANGPVKGDLWRIENGKRVVTKPRGSDKVAGVSASYDPVSGRYIIDYSDLPADLQNKGLGVAMYDRLVQEAHGKDMDITSDVWGTSAEAAKIYDALKRRGLKVNENPNIAVDETGGASAKKMGSSVWTMPKDQLSNKAYGALLAAGMTALAAEFLNGDDERRGQILALPILAVAFGERMPIELKDTKLPRPSSLPPMEYYGIDKAKADTSIHASPHAFNEFDVYRNAGRGQGAAAFGEGLYSAKSKGVQDSYFNEFFQRAPASIGGQALPVSGGSAAIPKKFLSKLNNLTIKQAIDVLTGNEDLMVDKAHHTFKREMMNGDGTSRNIVIQGMGSQGKPHAYFVVRDGGFAQPVRTQEGNYKIGNGGYARNLDRTLELGGVTDSKGKQVSIRDVIREQNRKGYTDPRSLMESAHIIDDVVEEYLNKLHKDDYYVEPGNLTAIAKRVPGSDMWKIVPFETAHLSKGVDSLGSPMTKSVRQKLVDWYSSPEEAMAAWNDFPRRRNNKPSVGISKERQAVADKLRQYAEDALIEKKTPQYRVQHAPEETYIDYNASLGAQHPYIRDRLRAVIKDLGIIEDTTNPDLSHMGGGPPRMRQKTGWEIYVELGRKFANKLLAMEHSGEKASGVNLSKKLDSNIDRQGRLMVSRYLNSIGIGGIRYPSSGMRNETHPNYVHFHDPQIIETNIGQPVQKLR